MEEAKYLPRPKPLQVFEHEKLTLVPDSLDRYLKTKELDRLWAYNDANDNKYFTGIRGGIKFKNYVGVIQIGGLTIEILPKTDKNTSSKEELSNWHGALLKMLKICKHLKVNSVSEASLKHRPHSILELYYEMFMEEVEKLLRTGLVKNYRKQSSNVLALKGRLEFGEHIKHNLVHQERFYTNHQVYDYENLINQIILKGLTTLKSLSNNSLHIDRINRIQMSFPEIKEIPIQKHHFDKVKENRKTIKYERALQIARMLILNYSPDIRSGQENMLTLLFDMNKLWEEYIYRMLLKTDREKWEIKSQRRKDFWENREIKPDLVVKNRITEQVYIIDTKWKVLTGKNPKPTDDDLKQMYAYNMYWEAEKSMLLYPRASDSPEPLGNFHMGRVGVNQCKIGFINVLGDDNYLDLSIGEEILEKIV